MTLSKDPGALEVSNVTTASGLVPFRHLHVAMRSLAFMLAFNRARPTPFDEERKDAIEAIREALAHPVPGLRDTATTLQSDLAQARAQRDHLQNGFNDACATILAREDERDKLQADLTEAREALTKSNDLMMRLARSPVCAAYKTDLLAVGMGAARILAKAKGAV